MKILIVNTSAKTGGAAIAANRLMTALTNNGHHVKMLVAQPDTDDIKVVPAMRRWHRLWCFMMERLTVLLHLFTRRGLWEIDPARFGCDITCCDEFREADVVHLHWVNQGFLSLSSLQRVFRSGKPVVVTMHDMWFMTGLCHYAHDCNRWIDGECVDCPLHGCRNWAHRVWRRKRNVLECSQLRPPVFVGCSEWMAGLARRSGLLQGFRVMTVPNTIDTRVFAPVGERFPALPINKQIILFAAQKVTDPRKGMEYLIEALHHIGTKEAVVAVLGANADTLEGRIPQQFYALGYQSDPHVIASIYRSISVFVTPSLSDNLPNTIMEAMACGVPCVGFRVGGIPEMIDHRKNGYVAETANPVDLAAGIDDVLCHRREYSTAALHKVNSCYANDHVARLYVQAYEQAARPLAT